MEEDLEIIREFLIESTEGIARLEQELVLLEKKPDDPQLLASIFRVVHSLKGTCGFLGFSHLEALAHGSENLLAQLRKGEKELTRDLATLILDTADAVKRELASIEATCHESGEADQVLCDRIVRACAIDQAEPAPSQPVEAIFSRTGTASIDALQQKEAVRASEQGEPAKCVSTVSDLTIRVDVGHLDKVMNLVGELVLARNQILQFTNKQDDAALHATAQRLNLITTQLQEGVMKTRMQPIGVVWNKLPRLVRDLAASCGKQVELEMVGSETELDKSIIEAIRDPLTHLVRNCCDHGIELPADRSRKGKPLQGKLSLRAYHEGGQVNIEISDDGAGIDVERVANKAVERGLLRPDQVQRMSDRDKAHLIFLPGLSTAASVTSISGRGVGMDVVKTNIEKIGGTIDLVNQPGSGVTVKIRIPLTLAIIPGLVIKSGGERFVIPQASLLELIRLEAGSGGAQIERIHGTPVYRRRGSLLPIAYLNQVLKLSTGIPTGDAVNIAVLQADDQAFGLVVDAISDTQEIVVKPLGKQLKGLTGFAGATIMGDGGVALILDVTGIGKLAGVVSNGREQSHPDQEAERSSHKDAETFLLFRAGRCERLAVPLSTVTRLEEFTHQQIEYSAGKLVVQYRNQILRLVPLASLLEHSDPANLEEYPDPLQVIVFADENKLVGIIVDQILDIHSEHLEITKKGGTPGIAGSAVLARKVTDFLDLPFVLTSVNDAWSGTQSRLERVLVVDERRFTRSLMRNYIELAGYRVVEAPSWTAAVSELEHSKIAAMLLAEDLVRAANRPSLDGMAASSAPVIVFGDSARSPGDLPTSTYVSRLDHEGILLSLNRAIQQGSNRERMANELADQAAQNMAPITAAEMAGSAR
jgi:two-component system chemotaxis sensor kinase CheA